MRQLPFSVFDLECVGAWEAERLEPKPARGPKFVLDETFFYTKLKTTEKLTGRLQICRPLLLTTGGRSKWLPSGRVEGAAVMVVVAMEATTGTRTFLDCWLT
jgi:hypothetical protein